MKKIVLLCAMAFAAAGFASAQNNSAAGSPQKITVTYKADHEVLSEFERGLADFNGLRYMEVHLDSPRTLVGLVEVTCRNGEVSEKELMADWYTISGVGKLVFYAQGISADSVKIMTTTDGGGRFSPRVTALPNTSNYILMEIYDSEGGTVSEELTLEYSADSAIPLIAYTTGLISETELYGEKATWIDFCGLRDKHAHPSRWHKDFGVDNYIYYLAKFK